MQKLYSLFLIPTILMAQIDKSAQYFSNIEDKANYGTSHYEAICNTIKPISLYDEGKSLHNVTQQDQDGLGTCYANTTSLVLKSHNPNLPTPSYLNLAGLNSYNDDKKVVYKYNDGSVCSLLNSKLTEDDYKQVKTIELCEDGLLENTSSSYQQEILEKLYNLLDKDDIDKNSFKYTFEYYKSLRSKNDINPQVCTNEDVTLNKYTHEDLFNYFEDFNFTEGSNCSKLITDSFLNRSILIKGEFDDFDLHPEFESMLSQNFEFFLTSNKDENTTPFKSIILKYLNKTQSYNDFEKKYLNNENPFSNSNNFEPHASLKLKNIAEETSKQYFNFFKEYLPKDDVKIQSCISQIDESIYKDKAELILSTIAMNCHREYQESIYKSLRDFDATCSPKAQEIKNLFRELELLGATLDDIEKFVYAQETSPLLDLIKPLCKKRHQYKVDGKNCQLASQVSGLNNLQNPQQWHGFKNFEDDIINYLALNKGTFIYHKFLEYLLAKYNDPLFQNEIEGRYRDKEYMDLLNYIATHFKDKASPTENIIRSAATSYVQEKIQSNLNASKDLISQITQGKAVGIHTCGSLFKDSDKKDYQDCKNHYVTATGYKCVNGKLKIETANSWGISCTDNEDSKNLFECQKDVDGITNGRSWVDYNYLSNQGMGFTIIK